MSLSPRAPSAAEASLRSRVQTALQGKRVLALDPTQSIPRLLKDVHGILLSVGQYETLSATQLRDVDPEVILAPLVAPNYDILDLMRELREMAYTGAVRAYCNPLPSLKIVRAEVVQIWAECDFEIFEVPQMGDALD